MPSSTLSSVSNALDMLRLLMFETEPDSGETMSNLARSVGVARNTAHRLLRTLAAKRFVDQRDDSRYTVGPLLEEYARIRTLRSSSTQARIRKILEDVTESVGEGSTFTILAGGRRIVVARTSPNHAVRVSHDALEGQNPFDFITGRVLLAFSEQSELETALRRFPHPEQIWHEIVRPGALEAELAAIREAGNASRVREKSDVWSVASPVMDDAQKLLGAVGIFAPAYRCPPLKQMQCSVALQDAAGKIKKLVETREEEKDDSP